MERHTIAGEQILAPVEFLAGVRALVRHEHERWDGAGYPDGLAGEAIPLGSRIILACDALHAMTSDRPYRAALLARGRRRGAAPPRRHAVRPARGRRRCSRYWTNRRCGAHWMPAVSRG